MIESVLVRDFQSHYNSELVFHPGVNVICGLSQAGKSALLRALGLVIDNRPRGEGFIREGCKEASVAVTVNRDIGRFGVIRTKGSDENTYRIIRDGDDLVFTAFGADVPKEIRDIFNLSDVNFQHQLSPYFLVLDAPGQVALYIRKAVGIEEIDEIIKLLNTKLRDASQKKDVGEFNLAAKEKKLDRLKEIDLERFSESLKAAEGLLKKDCFLRTELTSLTSSLDLLIEVQSELSSLNRIDFKFLEETLKTCSDLETKRWDLSEDLLSLQGLLDDLRSVDKELSVVCLPPCVDELLVESVRLLEKRRTLVRGITSLEVLLDEFTEADTSIVLRKKDLSLALSEFDKLAGELTICPSCGQKLTTKDAKDHLMGELNVRIC